MKTVLLEPIGEALEVVTGSRLLDGLLAKKLNITMACGGKGLCATCHVYVREGHDLLTPKTARENRTLGFVTGTDADSRLSCQCHVLGEGITIELPSGTYVEKAQDIFDLIGERASSDFLHPVNGSVLIPKGKIITRTMLSIFDSVSKELERIRAED